MSMVVEHGPAVSHVYPHRRDYPRGLLWLMLLLIGLTALFTYTPHTSTRRFGQQTIARHPGRQVFTSLDATAWALALAATWACWGYASRRWVFDRAAGRVRHEWRVTPWHWTRALERPFDWIHGVKLKVRRGDQKDEKRSWDVTLEGTCGAWYVLGNVRKADEAQELLEPLSDILPRLKKGG